MKDMKTVFASLLFTLVTTTSMAQMMKPEYDWNNFDEKSYQLHKKELNQYYDSKKEEVIKEYSSGWRTIDYTESKKVDLEVIEVDRKADLDMLEYYYELENESQLQKMIRSIKVFRNSVTFKYGVLPISIGFLLGILLVVFRKTTVKI
jgi:predicted transcriptional regulator